MAYLGKGLNDIATANVSVDTMTGDGSDTTLALSMGTKGIGSVNDVSVFIGGIQQRPNVDYTLSAGVVTFTTAPMNGQAVCAISHSDSWQDNVADSSVVTESFADSSITDAKIIGLDSSKLSGAMPAIDGSALTGITETTNSASDPAINSNGTLGDIWANTTSGEMYVLTDATAGENVWTNVGGGEGDVKPFAPQGTLQGFCSGGYAGGARINVIEKYSFTANGNSSDHGDLTAARDALTGTQSKTHGYCSGGENPKVNVLDKFAFSANANATTVGTMTVARSKGAGNSSETHGYTAGGNTPTPVNIIDRFAFASDGTAADVGDMTTTKEGCSGTSSTTHGYMAGGYHSGYKNIIDKFSYAASANATDVGDLTGNTYESAGSQV